MRFAQKGKIFDFLNYNDFYKEKIYKLISVDDDNCFNYLITFQFIGDFGEIVTCNHKICKFAVNNFLKELQTSNYKSKFNK